jgi:hypothetical protein
MSTAVQSQFCALSKPLLQVLIAIEASLRTLELGIG